MRDPSLINATIVVDRNDWEELEKRVPVNGRSKIIRALIKRYLTAVKENENADV